MGLKDKAKALGDWNIVVHSIGAGVCAGLIILIVDAYGKAHGWWK